MACLARHIARHGYRMVQASGTINDLYVSLLEARARLGQGLMPETTAAFRPPVAPADVVVEPYWHETLASRPLSALRERFELDDESLRLLVAAAGCALSVDVARLYTFAWADFAVKRPTVGFLCELVSDDSEASMDKVRAFAPHAPLLRQRLVELRDELTWGLDTPLIHRSVHVAESVVEFLRRGFVSQALPARLSATSVLRAPDEARPIEQVVAPEGLADEVVALLEKALREGGDGRPRLLLTGTRGSGRRTTAAAALRQWGKGTLTTELGRLPREPELFLSALAVALREALLRGVVPILRMDGLTDGQGEERARWEAVAAATFELLDLYEGPLLLTHLAPFPAWAVGAGVDERRLAYGAGACDPPRPPLLSVTRGGHPVRRRGPNEAGARLSGAGQDPADARALGGRDPAAPRPRAQSGRRSIRDDARLGRRRLDG